VANLKYACLILDHDDTTVDSTSMIHYPAYLEAMRILRPGFPVLTLAQFFVKHIGIGFYAYLRDELKMDPAELERELNIWREFTRQQVPKFYPEMVGFLKDYRAHGGIIAVSSHSEVEIIERDYRANMENFLPDIIFGWDELETRRKPDPYPVLTTMEQFHLRPEQILVVDDLKWGIIMGKGAGIATAAAGWGYKVPEVESYMRSNCDYYWPTVREFRENIIKD
jgi:phosphoglycolate phosphatase/pyrophosphatase PpaX